MRTVARVRFGRPPPLSEILSSWSARKRQFVDRHRNVSPREARMKLGLINSAWMQASQPTVFGIQKTKEIGFDSIDLLVDPLEMEDVERHLIKHECHRLDLPIVSIACVAFGLTDFNPSVRKFHLRRVEKHLDLAHDYAATNVLLVLGEYVWNKEIIRPDEQWKLGAYAVRELGNFAANYHLEIVIELEPFPLSLVNSVDTMLKFLDDVGLPNVKANIDISHLALSKVAPQELRRLKGRAGHVHISDCNGIVHGDLPPGRGVVEFEPYLREIKNLDIDGAISVELEYAPQPDKIVSWVEEAYRETNKLLRSIGLRN
jgi:sugar phosphate isomerase/epimerase